MLYFKKPKEKHIHFSRTEGRFDLLSSDINVQYFFTFPELDSEQLKELDIVRSYLVDAEEDCNWEGYTALELAYELERVYGSYAFNSRLPRVKKLIAYLESVEEEQDELIRQYDVSYAIAKVNYWCDKLEAAEKRL